MLSTFTRLHSASYKAGRNKKHCGSAFRVFKTPLVDLMPIKSFVFVLGCQRSGTNMMMNTLRKDSAVRVYNEYSELSDKSPDKLRLNPLSEVAAHLEKNVKPVVVLKPLVESQNADIFLDYFPRGKILWMFRHYKDVVASNLDHFGMDNGIKDIAPIANGESNNWRAEKVSSDVYSLITNKFAPDMNKYDAAALFWYARNSFFYELGLERNARVCLVNYEELVTNPKNKMVDIYKFIDFKYPGNFILEQISASSVGKGKKVSLSPEIQQLCESLWQRLRRSYDAPILSLSSEYSRKDK